ncbi:SDR family oxidoreductase [Streptomyces sp. NPDC052095]|uniref:SDR family NAD(P)-dependent oxidoreductase n=1 Tax=unclassified Streptomyces TaxID=2593676 RepID=UPI00344B25C6
MSKHIMGWPAGEAAFVTGAASGIGLGIARALVAAGARVALADIDGARLKDVAAELTDAGGTVTAVELDVSDAEQWSAAAERAEEALGPISILCNNAGVTGGGPLDETPLDVWRWIYRINIEGQFIGVSTFLPRFKRRGGRAHIMSTASMTALLPTAGLGAYSSSKLASVGLAMALREELRGTDIGVSVLCPGTVATRINTTAGAAQAKATGSGPDAGLTEQMGTVLAQGADPDRVGEQVVEAMRDRSFHIFTHSDFGPLVLQGGREIEKAFAELDDRHGPDPSARMLIDGTNPIAS